MPNKVNINAAALHDTSFEKDKLHDYADFYLKSFFWKDAAAVYSPQTENFSCYRKVFKNIDDNDLDIKVDNRDDIYIKERDDKRNSQKQLKCESENNNSAFSLIGENSDDSCKNHTTVYPVTTKIVMGIESSSELHRLNKTKLFGDPTKICESKQAKTSNESEICTSLSNGNESEIVDINSNSLSEEIWIYRETEKIGTESKRQTWKGELAHEDHIRSKNLDKTNTIEKVGSKVNSEQKDNTCPKDKNIVQQLDFTGDAFRVNSRIPTINGQYSEKVSEKWKISHIKSNLELPTEQMFFTNFSGVLFNIKETNVRCMEDMRDAILHNYSTKHEERNSILTVQTFKFLLSRLVDNRVMYPTEDGGYRVIGSRRPKPKKNRRYLGFGNQKQILENGNASEKIQKTTKNKDGKAANSEKRNKVKSEVKSAKPKLKRKKRRNVLFGYVCMKIVVKLSKTFPLL